MWRTVLFIGFPEKPAGVLPVYTRVIQLVGVAGRVCHASTVCIAYTLCKMSPPRKLKSLTIEKKIEILKKVESGIKKKVIAQEYDIPQSTLSTIIKNKATILQFGAEIKGKASFKRNRPSKTVNTALVKWFGSAREKNLPVSGPVLKQKALDLAQKMGDNEFKASSGWLEKFKKR